MTGWHLAGTAYPQIDLITAIFGELKHLWVRNVIIGKYVANIAIY